MSHQSADSLTAEEEIDESILLRDDVLIDALAKGVLPMEYSEDELVHDLLVWRDEICSTSIPEHVGVVPEELPADTGYSEDETQILPPLLDVKSLTRAEDEDAEPKADTATQRKKPGAASTTDDKGPASRPDSAGGKRDKTRPRRTASTRAARSPWLKRPLAITAALVAIALGSLGSMAAATTAQPGSALWPIAKVVDKDRAESLEARESAFEQLEDARAEMKRNNTQEAQQHLDEAIAQAESVRGRDGRSQLDREVKNVREQLASSQSPTPSPTPSGSSPTPQPTTPTPTPSTPSPTDETPTPSPTASTSAPSPTKSTN